MGEQVMPKYTVGITLVFMGVGAWLDVSSLREVVAVVCIAIGLMLVMNE